MKTQLLLTAAILVIGTGFSRADDKPATPAPPVGELSVGKPCSICCESCCSHRFHWRSLSDWVHCRHCRPCKTSCHAGCGWCGSGRFWDWLTYRPLCCCDCCQWSVACCCTPPLYAYFLCTDGCVQPRPCPPPCDTAAITRDMPWNPPSTSVDNHDPFKREPVEPKGMTH